MEEKSGPSWERPPLGVITSPPAGDVLLRDLETGGASKKKISFLEQQQSAILNGLLGEIEALKTENRDIKYRLVMRHTDSKTDSSNETTHVSKAAYDARASELASLQQLIEEIRQDKEDLEFDLRTEINFLKTSMNISNTRDNDIEELLANKRRLQEKIEAQAAEIRKLRSNQGQSSGSAQSPPNKLGTSASFHDRDYVFNFENFRKHKRNKNPTQPPISQDELRSITMNRKRIRTFPAVSMNEVETGTAKLNVRLPTLQQKSPSLTNQQQQQQQQQQQHHHHQHQQQHHHQQHQQQHKLTQQHRQ